MRKDGKKEGLGHSNGHSGKVWVGVGVVRAAAASRP